MFKQKIVCSAFICSLALAMFAMPMESLANQQNQKQNKYLQSLVEWDECHQDEECGDGAYCFEGMCFFVDSTECYEDADCGDAGICDAGTCFYDEAEPCYADADCGENLVCDEGECWSLSYQAEQQL